MGEITALHLAKKGFTVFAGVFLEDSPNNLKKKANENNVDYSDRIFPVKIDVTNSDSIQKVQTNNKQTRDLSIDIYLLYISFSCSNISSNEYTLL